MDSATSFTALVDWPQRVREQNRTSRPGISKENLSYPLLKLWWQSEAIPSVFYMGRNTVPSGRFQVSTGVEHRMTQKQIKKVVNALKAVVDVEIECQFWACEGETLDPIPMKTCRACYARALVKEALTVMTAQCAEKSQRPKN